jgi:hypothetical protein
MSSVTASAGSFSVKAYAGDFKTLLAFNLAKGSSARLAGFTIATKPGSGPAYYLLNQLQFQFPEKHAQDPNQLPNSSINAPYRKFRWLHVPGSFHQGLAPFVGPYSYTVTPRYFDDKQSLEPLDPSLSVTVTLNVAPFKKGGLELGFTRGFTQSQAFVHHFGLKALIRPKERTLLFDTGEESGTNDAGEKYTYAEEYAWLGFTARTKILDILREVQQDATSHVDVFAYDLNEPDVLAAFLALAKAGRIRIVLDNAALHHDAKNPTPEDDFEEAFREDGAGTNAAILRGKFGRYSHDKVLIVSKNGKPVKVLTGSTNFSITGLYVNSNHVLVFNDETVAAQYAALFQSVWDGKVSKSAFVGSELSAKRYSIASATIPQTEITFAPHAPAVTQAILDGIAARIDEEGKKADGSVLFAVMAIDQGESPVYTALKELHSDQAIFSFGISDNPGGIALYKPGTKNGVLVTGKPLNTMLPPPFNQVPNIGGVGHQVHHKFVVCGFNGSAPVVYCGSSNLAIGGEQNNGDNLLAIHDGDVATVFAIEALGLVDHFNFLDKYATGQKGAPSLPVANPQQGALDAHWYLEPSDAWAGAYFDSSDLHCADRELFGA